MYASGITYTGVASISPSAGTLTGANDGLSPSTVTPGNVVLGQDVAQALDPAILLKNREIPGAGFQLNLFNGNLIVSDARKTGAGGRMEVYDSVTGATAKTTVLINPVWNTTGAPIAVLINPTNTASSVASAIFVIQESTRNIFNIQASGNINLVDPLAGLHGLSYGGFSGSVYNNTTLRSALNSSFAINALWHPNATIDPAVVNDVQLASTVTLDNVANVQYTALNIQGGYTMSVISNGQIRGIFYHPTIPAPLPVQHIAFENQSGDVLLCNSNPGANNLGTVGIRINAFPGTSPTAYLEIGPGQAAAGLAPLKLSAGTSLTAPESGAIEFNGTNLFFTPGATRQSIFVGNSGATAPGLTATPVFTSFYGGNTNALGDPVSWASVVIGGTTFKIPLYT